ncbi:MAG TPA: hypothetical protein VK886_05620 [Vicinamibacterales bacterium]|nr:hypothetical protein [Vicinamibacterales bacterium]
MPRANTIDRSDLVDKAARLVTRGDLVGAASLYERLFQNDSKDWSIANTLGDLYVRIGKADAAIAHFTSLAEQLGAEGFAAKQRAVYRKILRIQPDNAIAKQRVDELERQESGRVSPFLKRVLETARAARETTPAVPAPEPSPEEHDPAAPVEPAAPAAPPAVAAPPLPVTPPQATVPSLLPTAPQATAPPSLSSPSPTIVAPPRSTPPPVTAPPAPAAVAAPVPAPPAVTAPPPAPAAVSAPPPTPPAATALRPAPAAVTAPPPIPPAVTAAATSLPSSSREWADEWAAVLLSDTTPDSTTQEAPAQDVAAPDAGDHDVTDFYQVVVAADADAARRNFAGAVGRIERFLTSQPLHIDALEKLIDVGVDGRLDETLITAQSRLASACFEAGRVEQARNIAVDLTEREPDVAAHRQLLARITPEGVQREREAAEEPLEAWTVIPAAAATGPSPIEAGSDVVDQAFEEIRTSMIEDAAAAAEERLAEADRLLAVHKIDEAILALEEAACAPHLRATAGSRLAGVRRDRGEPLEALECLEWVAQVPPATEEGGHELAYQLALTLESVGQHDQALGVYRELLAEVGPAYRDVATRAERLAAA